VEKTLNIKFRYTEKEYSEAVKLYYSDSLNIKVDIIISIIMIFIGSFFWITGNDSIINIIAILLGCILLLMMILVLYVNPKRVFRQEPKFRDEYNLNFKNDGILFQTEHINSSIAWNHYSKIKENKNFFYLIYGKYMFTIIPKRTFSNREDEEFFRKLIGEKIK
jgi:hypothetical protein